MIFYFSGTGNSCQVAVNLGKVLQEKVYAMTDALEGNRKYVLLEKETVGFVFPVHAWGPPEVVLRFIGTVCFNRSPDNIYMVCTCGDDTGKTTGLFKRAIGRRGWECRAGFSVVMPNTYVCLPGFDVDPLPLARKKLYDAEKRISEIAGNLRARKFIFDCHEGSFPRIKSYLIRPLFRCFLMSSRLFRVEKNPCISCGKCVQACPLNNIRLEWDYPVWGNRCTMCLACYHHCPKHAISYGGLTKKKGQYVNG